MGSLHFIFSLILWDGSLLIFWNNDGFPLTKLFCIFVFLLEFEKVDGLSGEDAVCTTRLFSPSCFVD